MAQLNVSDAASVVLDEMGYLRIAMRNDLVNYSALARFIKPMVEEKMGWKEAGDDALIMAVRRYCISQKERRPPENFLKVLGNSKLVLRTGMAVLHFRRASDLYKRLVEIERNKVNWHQGDKMYILQRSEEIMVIASHKLLPTLKSVGHSTDIMAEYGDTALITIEWSSESLRTPGIVAFITSQIEAINVNLLGIFNTISKMSLLVDEADASKAYDKLSKTVEQCKQAAEYAK
ncbi:hypothetical protein HY995_05245 [Candidatus Micrarchaeota archaeon]|nr:hypothetical protein [Candidatus Micrarchaeota archaeon]